MYIRYLGVNNLADTKHKQENSARNLKNLAEDTMPPVRTAPTKMWITFL